jgi:hypothetical protein
MASAASAVTGAHLSMDGGWTHGGRRTCSDNPRKESLRHGINVMSVAINA